MPFEAEPELFDFAVVAGFDASLSAVGFCVLCTVLGSADSDTASEFVSSALVCALTYAAVVFSAAVMSASGVLLPHAVKLMRISRHASKSANIFLVICILLLNISSKSIISLCLAQLYAASAF